MASMRFFYVLVMSKKLTFEELFMFEYMFGDKPLDKKVYVNGDSLNGLNFYIFFKKSLWQCTYQPITKLYDFYHGYTKVGW